MTDSKKEQELEEILRKGEKEVAKNVKKFLVEQASLLVPFPKESIGAYQNPNPSKKEFYDKDTNISSYGKMEGIFFFYKDSTEFQDENVSSDSIREKRTYFLFVPEGDIYACRHMKIIVGGERHNEGIHGVTYTGYPNLIGEIENSEYLNLSKHVMEEIETRRIQDIVDRFKNIDLD